MKRSYDQHRILVTRDEYIEHYVLEEATRPELNIAPDETVGTLRFFTAYYEEYDEDGCRPPKYLVGDGELDELVERALGQIGQANQFEMCAIEEKCDFEMSTYYVLPEKRVSISHRELRDFRRTRFEVPVRRIDPHLSHEEEEGEGSDSENEAEAIRIPVKEHEITVTNQGDKRARV